ncbi:dihydrofolate reductase family protein [Actinokineospora sp. HUAS TT18]|uniref:dihydrofolate reductase family protein n=1 Tax=Actinokineospora sp. HUAS TT18 TaxID=3447451 RepID=UPI003F520090
MDDMGNGRVVFDITMSLDGYITAPGDSQAAPLGVGGDVLHDWIAAAGAAGDPVLSRLFTESGAVIAGRRTYDNSSGPDGWGTGPIGDVPVFVLTSRPTPPTGVFTFVTDGIKSALTQARAVAGDKDVYIMGGADIARQYLAAGLVDEVRIHHVPAVLCGGVRLFEGPVAGGLEITDVSSGAGVTHITYRVTESPKP